jgi:hypothetical protein
MITLAGYVDFLLAVLIIKLTLFIGLNKIILI